MKKITFGLLIFTFLSFSFAVVGQTPKPIPTPPPTVEDTGDVVKISTNLIQIDVVVTDKKGNQVTDLKPEDFEIYENGKLQDITNFSYIFNAKQTSDSPKTDEKQNDKLAAPIPPIKLKPEQVRRTYALVVDDLGLSFESVPTIKYTLKKFITEQIQEGDLVAIIRTGGGIGALQSFTSDKRQLFAAVDKIKWNFVSRDEISLFDFIEPTSKTPSARKFERQSYAARNNFLAIGTLGALSYVVRGMKQLPGRKAVMLFSEGFSARREENGRLVYTDIYRAVRTFADLANRSSVTVYPLDPRGLINPVYSAPESATPNTGFYSISDSQAPLRYMADETGGIAYVNQNDLSYGLNKAIADQSGYYLIGYQPDSETFDPQQNRFNKFKIKVKRDDIKVRYRSGFFGITDEEIANVEQTPTQQIYSAVTSPFNKNDISLTLNTLFGNDPKNGNFIRSLIYINGKDLKFIKAADGKRKADFDILAITFGDNGVPIDQFAKSFTMQVTEETYQKILQQGFTYNFPVPIKKPGAYQFRIALRDANAEKVGSASQFVEVPNLKKKKLTLSGILLDDYTLSEWRKISLDENQFAADENGGQKNTDIDTALRRFKRGTVLRYGYIIYNAKTPSPQILVQTKLFRDGQLFLEGKQSLLVMNGQTDLKRLQNSGTLMLGNDLKTGDYVLQIVVKDELTNKLTSQFIDFEIVE